MKKIRDKCHACGRYTRGDFTILVTASDGSRVVLDFCTRKHIRDKIVAIVTERA